MMGSRVAWAIVVGVAACAAVGVGVYLARDDARVDGAKRDAPVAASCDSDAQCIGPRHALAAAAACRPLIENLAGFGVRWTDPTGTVPRFTRYAWRDHPGGALTLSGDDVAFASAAGDAQPVNYACDFDPVSGKATDVRVQPGRLR